VVPGAGRIEQPFCAKPVRPEHEAPGQH